MRNWRTTLMGIGAILPVVIKIINIVTGTGHIGDLNAADAGLVSAGIGLWKAKDHNVSGTGQAESRY